jgi:hypothetical protein
MSFCFYTLLLYILNLYLDLQSNFLDPSLQTENPLCGKFLNDTAHVEYALSLVVFSILFLYAKVGISVFQMPNQPKRVHEREKCM